MFVKKGYLQYIKSKLTHADQLIDTLNATRSIIIAHTSQQNYDDLVEQCNNDYTKECHDLMHVILPGDDCEDILVVEDDVDSGNHAKKEKEYSNCRAKANYY